MNPFVAVDASAQERAAEPAGRLRSLEQQLDACRRENEILRKSEQGLETQLGHASAMILTLDREGTITSANHRLVGGPPMEMVGRCAMDYLPAARHEEFQQRLRRSYETGRPDRWEYAIPNGRWYEAHGAPVVVDGAVTTLVVTIHDVTLRKRAEERSRRRLADLAHVHRLNTMGRTVAELAHEIAQPLYAIANYAHASAEVVRSGTKSGDLLTWLERIAEESTRAGAIVRRIGSTIRKAKPCRGELDLNALIAKVLDLLEPRTRREGVAVTFSPARFLPPVVADEVQIEQVLVNLVQNAVDAMAATDTGCRRLQLDARPNDRGTLRVAVRDTGAGIAAVDLQHVFKPFYSTKANEMGVGLAICRSIVEDHGGHIQAERNADGGSLFSFTLPLSSQGRYHARTAKGLCRRR
ncbi:MAG: ATP-binding protein [Planctomycetia bacterium]|nr:ATP-binding protein [Planctomycetia bacterium]